MMRAGALATCAVALACKQADPQPTFVIAGDVSFDGVRMTLVAARGETVGVRVEHAAGEPATLAFARSNGVRVDAFAVERYVVRRASTDLYGGGNRGSYPDGLVAATTPTTGDVWFEIVIARDAAPGPRTGELAIGDRRVPVVLTIARVTLPQLAPTVWAYEDPRELGWAGLGESSADAPSAAERACVAMFRARGVLLAPEVPASAWPARKDLVTGTPFVPAEIPDDPARVGDAVRAWIALTSGTGQLPFAIPIDEPRTPEARAKVRTLAEAARAAGAGPGRFLFAVTDEPRPEYGDAIDLYVALGGAHLAGDRVARWTYNGAPPRAGSMVLDAAPPGPRTWGWIAWRWRIPIWYVWDALYWHDRHGAKRTHAPLPGRTLDPRADTISFDDGDDRGNLDGVLALPGDARTPCKPTLRLASIRRGLFDRALLDAVARCAPAEASRVAAELVPTALGDAPASGRPSWPTDETAWEAARRALIERAEACAM
jgi:hypothetical protein